LGLDVAAPFVQSITLIALQTPTLDVIELLALRVDDGTGAPLDEVALLAAGALIFDEGEAVGVGGLLAVGHRNDAEAVGEGVARVAAQTGAV
jgi:hypothetical protein